MFTPAANPLLAMRSIVWILTICHVIHASGEGLRLTRRSVLPSSQQQGHSRQQSSSNNRSAAAGEEGDQKSDPSSHSIRLLPPPDMIIDSFLRSPHAQLVTQRNSPPKDLIDGDRGRVFQRTHAGEAAAARRLPPPPQTPAGPLSRQPPQHHSQASLAVGASLREEIVPLMPGLDQLQKHVIPIEAISKDIESAIQRIVADIVNRREKVFYHLPNSVNDKMASPGSGIMWERRKRLNNKKKKQQRAEHEAWMRDERRPATVSSVRFSGRRPPLRHVPPPPAAHRTRQSPDSLRPAGNHVSPYYAMAKNGLGPGLRSLADYVKSLRHESRTESENEGSNYISMDERLPVLEHQQPRGLQDSSANAPHETTPVTSFMIEIPDGLELPVPDPASPVTPALIQPYRINDDELSLLHSDWIGVQSAHERRGLRQPDPGEVGEETGRQRNVNGYRPPAAFVDSGSGSESAAAAASPSPDQGNLSEEQIRINKEVLLPFLESIVGESNNRIGVYIPQPSPSSSSTSIPSSSSSADPLQTVRLGNHSSLMRGGLPATATTSYSSGMTGIRKKKPCPGK